MTRVEQILSGNKEALISEIIDAITWARGLTKEEWYCITHDSRGGIHAIVREVVESQLIRNTVLSTKPIIISEDVAASISSVVKSEPTDKQ